MAPDTRDRSRRQCRRGARAGGLRSLGLVGFGSCLFMVVSGYGFRDLLPEPKLSFDPTRIAAQVVVGIGFLGAGTIVFRQRTVQGLTTAASIWVVAAMG